MFPLNNSIVCVQDIVTATAALEEVKQSGKFRKILELILLMGNYMNAGSRNEKSIGFEFSFITKVNLMNSIQFELNSLHYIYRQ